MSLTGRIKKAANAFNKDDESSERDLLTPTQRKGEEAMLAKIMSEIESGKRRKGVWAKAVMDSDGDEAKAESLYLKYAVQSLVDEWTIEAVKKQEQKEWMKQERKKRRENIIVIIILIGVGFMLWANITN